nr:9485_t:CDS:2 [Entrophospora candida]
MSKNIGTTIYAKDMAKLNHALANQEVKLIILNHSVCSPNDPTGLLYRIFMWIYMFTWLCRGGEHHSLLISQFKDTEDGFMLKKYHLKNDQGGIKRRQASHVISFPKDPSGPNHDPNDAVGGKSSESDMINVLN